MGKRKRDKKARAEVIASTAEKTAPPRQSLRQYAGAKASRLLFTAPTSSADSELYTSLTQLRNRSRQLVRDSSYAKRAKLAVVNNVIGAGVGMQAKVENVRGRYLDDVNDAIERAWKTWSAGDQCHTGGALAFGDFERAALAEVFEAGEVFIRLHAQRFGASDVPLGLELIEAERIADDHRIPSPTDGELSLGIEHDGFHRPIAYWFHAVHPGFHRGMQRIDRLIRVPAADVIHLRLVDRWPQTRGVPWLHAAISRLHQANEFEDAAVVAARIGASKVGFFENPEWPDAPPAEEENADGSQSMKVEAGQYVQLPPGYRFTSWDPTYPHENFEPFLRACLRGIAAGIPGLTYEALSGDMSQSNYSSSRMAELPARDQWRQLQQWWIRAFRAPLHRLWLQQAVAARAITTITPEAWMADMDRFAAVEFKPRGWAWVDPTKEVAAFKEAERAGYLTKADIIAATAGGADLEEVVRSRRQELDLLRQYDLFTDTTDAADAGSVVDDVPAPNRWAATIGRKR